MTSIIYTVVVVVIVAGCLLTLWAAGDMAKRQDEQAERQYREQSDMEAHRRLTDDL